MRPIRTRADFGNVDVLLCGKMDDRKVSFADLVERQLWRSQNTTEADAVKPAVLLKA